VERTIKEFNRLARELKQLYEGKFKAVSLSGDFVGTVLVGPKLNLIKIDIPVDVDWNRNIVVAGKAIRIYPRSGGNGLVVWISKWQDAWVLDAVRDFLNRPE